jgi:hypothetical protein
MASTNNDKEKTPSKDDHQDPKPKKIQKKTSVHALAPSLQALGW